MSDAEENMNDLKTKIDFIYGVVETLKEHHQDLVHIEARLVGIETDNKRILEHHQEFKVMLRSNEDNFYKALEKEKDRCDNNFKTMNEKFSNKFINLYVWIAGLAVSSALSFLGVIVVYLLNSKK